MICTLNIMNKKYQVHQVYTPQRGHTKEKKREYMEILDHYKVYTKNIGVEW